MGKYLMLWSFNQSLTPVNPQERAKGYAFLMDFIQKDFESGLLKDWGSFVGEGSGYCVVEGSEIDVSKMVQQYSPFCRFKTHPVASAEQMKAVIQSIAE